MQQRLCLAHTLVHDPQVLLLDEPASGLDPRARVELRELLRELRALGKTILVSSHILPELEELCTSVAIIDRGQVLAHGRVADIERRLRVGAVFRVRDPRRRRRASRPRAPGSPPSPTWSRRTSSTTARSRSASTATTRAPPACWPTAVGDGLRIATFARAASDLEELFLQVTAQDPVPAEAVRVSGQVAGTVEQAAPLRRDPRRRGRDGGRRRQGAPRPHARPARVRGPDAAPCCSSPGFAWMVESLVERTYSGGFGSRSRLGGDRAPAVHRDDLPADAHRARPGARRPPPARSASSARSRRWTCWRRRRSPRSRSSWASSSPLCPGSCCCCSPRSPSLALVFTFGGVGPDDVVRAYVVLLVTALAFGAVGLFVSALVKRTQAATVINLVAVISLTAGTAFIFIFWSAMTATGSSPTRPRAGRTRRVAHPPAARGAAVVQPVHRPAGRRCAAPRPDSAARARSSAASPTPERRFNGRRRGQGFGVDARQLLAARVAAMARRRRSCSSSWPSSSCRRHGAGASAPPRHGPAAGRDG